MGRYRFLHRIAVHNIATRYRIAGKSETFALAIRNDSAFRAGRIEYGAIGGGALITTEGCRLLSVLAPITFEFHDDNVQIDARMTYAAESENDLRRLRTTLMRSVLGWARSSASELIELEIARELVEELVDDVPGILTMAQLAGIHTRLVGWRSGNVRQSNRGTAGLNTTPLYLCHEAVFEDPSVLDALLNDAFGRVKFISPEELATTNGGKHEGRIRDGHVLFSNVFDPAFVRSF